MKNQNHIYRFWNPYHKFATPGFTVGYLVSPLVHLPFWVQVILGCIALFHLSIEWQLVQCIKENERSKRKIAEEDAKALRERQKKFSPDFRFLVSQAPNLSDSSTIALSKLLSEFYNANAHSNDDEITTLLGNIITFPYYENTANSPPKTHSRSKKEEKEKSYK